MGFKELAGAVLSLAQTDWNNEGRHHEVEAFLDGRLIDLYLDVAEIDKNAYLKSVRGDSGDIQD